jgi:hypothetical protein
VPAPTKTRNQRESGRSWWLRQSGILAPWSTIPAGMSGALVCSTAPGGSSAGVLAGSTVGVEDIVFGSPAEAAGCASFGSIAAAGKSPDGLYGSAAVLSGPADPPFGSTAVPAGGNSFGSTDAAGGSVGALSGSTLRAGAGEISFGSMAVDTGCVPFGSTAVAGSSGAFVSCVGRGRGNGGDDAIRWR